MINKQGLVQTHFVGAASEHLAAHWYLKQGYMILWPQPQQSNIDFVVFKDSVYSRIQVKTASMIKSGNYNYLQCRTRLTNKYKDIIPTEIYDTLFVVYQNNCWVIPAEIIDSSNISLGADDHKVSMNKWVHYRHTLVGNDAADIDETSRRVPRTVVAPPPPVEEINSLRDLGTTVQGMAAVFNVPQGHVKKWIKAARPNARAPRKNGPQRNPWRKRLSA